MSRTTLLTSAQMQRADLLTIAAGTPGIELMENAGRVCTEEIIKAYPHAETAVVLCGPGNNGGDGFVIARLLRDEGWNVRLALLGEESSLRGDAAQMAARWGGPVALMTSAVLEKADLVIDAIFGAGLARDVTGIPARMISAVEQMQIPVMAVDIPSGIDGATGQARGAAMHADLTVTFFRARPGHYLLPGRLHRGRLVVRDIGIKPAVLEAVEHHISLNRPALWKSHYPWPQPQGHKYSRGHALVVGGPAGAGGAARLAARAALRIGAGLVSLAAPPGAMAENAAQLNAIMLCAAPDARALSEVLKDRRKSACVIGPGLGLGAEQKARVEAVLKSGAASVLDADALSVFAGDLPGLQQLIALRTARPVVLTPHEGEFARLFNDMDRISESGSKAVESKTERALRAAKATGACIVLKGSDTVIAAPDGRLAINANAPPWLATAGSGDVLSGLIGGLLAQNMPPFEAACAGVWIHGKAARRFGPGLI
ncbi:MAG TPA: NAD(P)H-hydrate dehydratase, partial [Rhizobiales bacterium]|nr:NAD(P)H-hydrate dehydratase [Hyphomicrobiales bacterium]